MSSSSATTAYTLSVIAPLAATLALGAFVLARLAEPSHDAQVHERVETLAMPGDLTLLFPSDRFTEVDRYPATLDVIAADLPPLETAQFHRIIVVRDVTADAAELTRSLEQMALPLQQETVGDTVIALFQLHNPEVVVGDLAQDLPEARVFLDEEGTSSACQRVGDRFECGESAQWVGVRAASVEGERFECVSTPFTDNATVRVVFDAVSGGSLAGWVAREAATDSPVRLVVASDGADDVQVAIDRPGRNAIRIPLYQDEPSAVSLRFSTTSSTAGRVCWALYAVAPVPSLIDDELAE